MVAVRHGHYHHSHHHHHHGPRRRSFYLATAFTIAVVAYVVVPPLTKFIDSLAGYSPRNPAPRAQWLRSPAPGLGDVTWDLLLDLGLLLLVVIVWMTVVPRASGRRGPPP